jgi:ATP-dependent protease ClpP protease subunit
VTATAKQVLPVSTREMALTWIGHFDDTRQSTLLHAVMQCRSAGVKTIHLLLHSAGGRASAPCAPVALYNALRASGIRFITYNVGAVASGAILPFLAGEERCRPASRREIKWLTR